MAQSALHSAIVKLALCGQYVGFSIEEMIEILRAGVSVETLLGMIAARLETPMHQPSRWIMA
jgi:hypothetical protein